jgi:Nif-specific regulatory protein
MTRLASLLAKAEQLLKEQWESFSAIDQWIKKQRALPDEIREEWRRIHQLQDFLRRECIEKLVEEANPWEESRESLRILRFVRETLKFLEGDIPSLQGFLDYLARTLGADRGIVIACSEQSTQVRVLAAANCTESNLTLEEFAVSRTIFREVLRSGQGVLVKNAVQEPAYAGQTSIRDARSQSILAVPLLAHKRVIAILYLDRWRSDRSFSEADRLCLEQIVSLMKSLFFSHAVETLGKPGRGEVFLEGERALRGLVGKDPEFIASLVLLKKVAPTPAPVLLMGESGTGKELFARAIHALSPRKSGAFVAINCAAIPDSLIESELFGHEKGAFTGADSLRIGKIERASRGTLFLDEIGEMKLELQAKLLRFLQSNEIERIGGSLPLQVDVRIVAATNQDLASRVAERSFRQDLYFRLNVFHIPLPPLRARRSDIPILAEHFFQKYAAVLSLGRFEVQPEVYSLLASYDYPGNIRELENIVYRSLLLSEMGNVTPDCLPEELKKAALHDLQKNPFWHLLKNVPASYEELSGRKEEMKEICRREISYLERRFAEALVAASDGNVSKAAQIAGIDRGQFHRLLKSGDSP